MYPYPISITTGQFGSLLFLSFDSATAHSNVLLTQLHSPITKVQKDVEAKEVHFHDGVIFFVWQRLTNWFPSVNQRSSCIGTERLKTRQMILDKLHELGIEADGKVPALRKHIVQH